MSLLKNNHLKSQTPQQLVDDLQTFKDGDKITVNLEEKQSLSGPITSVITNGSANDLDEVHVQFQDFGSDFRHDDSGHHTVSVSRNKDGEWKRAELNYSWTDTGRVRRNTIDEVARVWADLSTLRAMTVLSRDEAKVISMVKMGLTEQEIAEQWGCSEARIDAVLSAVADKYQKARTTVDRLEATSLDLGRGNLPTNDRDSLDVEWREFDNQGEDADTE